jgi:hypothetical protein
MDPIIDLLWMLPLPLLAIMILLRIAYWLAFELSGMPLLSSLDSELGGQAFTF